MTESTISNAPDNFVYEVWVEFLDTGEKHRYSKVYKAKAPATALKKLCEKHEDDKRFRYFVVESQLVCTRVFE